MGDIGNTARAAATMGAAAIDSAAALGVAKMNNDNQAKIAQEYNQAQFNLAQSQNEYNLDMWNKTNQYNSPAAQMQRLEEAGLNPNLVYGSGSAVGNASTGAPEAVTPQLKMQQYQQYHLGDTFSRAVQNYWQNRVSAEQSSLAKSQREYVEAMRQGKLIENIMEGAATPFAKQIAERNMDMMESQYQEQRHKEVSAHYDAQTRQYRYMHVLPLEERMAMTDLALKEAHLNLSKAQKDEVVQRTAKIMYEIENILPIEYQLSQQKQLYMTKQIAIAGANASMLSQNAKFWEDMGMSKDKTKQIMWAIKAMIDAAGLLK